MKAEISVIIPVYNGEDCISIPINSLMRQTYKNFEVIIVDDGSTDKTAEVIKKYCNGDLRFKYIFQQNAGVSVARNKGILNSSGRYICFLDSDDYYEDTFLEKMFKTIKSTNSDVCYCGYYRVTPNKKSKKLTQFKSGNILKDFILGKIAVHTTGWMINKSLLTSKEIFFSKGRSWGEDFEFFCKILASTNKVSYVNEYLTNYRVDFYDNRLSAFSIEKIDKDFDWIKNLLKDERFNKNVNIRNALIDFRLSGLITYQLIDAFKYNVDSEIIIKYFNKYKKYIMNFKLNNGLRSIKLIINKFKLLYLIKTRCGDSL